MLMQNEQAEQIPVGTSSVWYKGGDVMDWSDLLSEQRLSKEEKEPKYFKQYPISHFERDYEKIVSSAAFRRLQDKTQVFPLAKSDFVRTRLTHSMEVSTIAKQLGIMCFQNESDSRHLYLQDVESDKDKRNERVGDIEAILSCAGLLHDLGNPPFGHVGEKIIGEWFEDHLKDIYSLREEDNTPIYDKLEDSHIKDLTNFEGNAQTFRILSKARHQSEINLPISIMGALIKYPTSSEETAKEPLIRHKVGYYQAEKETFAEIAKELGTCREDGTVVRHPLAYLVEAADDIAYMTADLEDAVKSGVVSVDALLQFLNEKWQEESEHFEQKKANYKTEPFSEEEKKKMENQLRCTKEIIDKLNELNASEKNPGKVMSQWGTYLRRWLMYVVCWRYSDSYQSILKGEYEYDLFYETYHSITVKLLKDAMKEFVFDSRVIIEPEVSAQTILNFLLDKFVPAVVHEGYDTMTTQDKKVMTLISQNYIDDYYSVKELEGITDEAELLYRKILIATDFISGMTDGYAKKLYKIMSGIE